MDVGDDCDAHGLPVAALDLSGARRRVGGRGVPPLGLDEGARTGSTSRGCMRRTSTPASCCTEASIYERFFWLDSLIADPRDVLVFWLYSRYGHAVHARVGGRADRHRDAARDARLRARLARHAAVRGRCALVGAPARRQRTSSYRGGDLRRLVRARRASSCSSALAVLVVMGFARWCGDRWWIPAVGVFIAALRALRLHLAVRRRHEPQAHQPAVRHRRVHREQLQADSHATKKEHVTDVPIRVQNVHGDTSAANAFTAGFGPTTQGLPLGHAPRRPLHARRGRLRDRATSSATRRATT